MVKPRLKRAKLRWRMLTDRIKIEEVTNKRDAELVSRLLDDTWKNYQRPHTPEDILQQTKSGEVWWYVLKRLGEPVGVGFVKRDGELGGWLVPREKRGKGYGELVAASGYWKAKKDKKKKEEELYVEAVTNHNRSQRIAENVLGMDIRGFLPRIVADAIKGSPFERTSFVVYGNYKPPERVTHTVYRLAKGMGLNTKITHPKEGDEPHQTRIFGVPYYVALTPEQMYYAEREGFVPVAFYPKKAVLFVDPFHKVIDLSHPDLSEDLLKFTEKGRQAYKTVISLLREVKG